jgi:hypothetical protein
MSLSLAIRRLGFTLLLAILITGAVAFAQQDAAALIFLRAWLGLFFAWPYLSCKFGFNFPKAPVPRPSRRTEWGRILGTGFLSFALSYALALLIHSDLFGPCLIVFWVILYYASPLLMKRLPYSGFARSIPFVTVPAPKRPFWRRTLRGSLTLVGGVALAIFLMAMTVIVPLDLCHRRAQKVHDSIHVGMTVPEVLHAAKDCDAFRASSDFPYQAKADDDNIPSMLLNWKPDGTYHTYNLAPNQDVELSEPEALEQLHAKLHDGYKWRFHYTYFNVTPQHVSFTVAFGANGRVTEVTPVYGWD